MGKKKDKETNLGTEKRILVAPLDWGLGHATRCVPIIRGLIQQNHQVFLAGDGAVQRLLQTEFPTLPFLELPGYKVRYAKKASNLSLSLLAQVPKITRAIYREKRWLQAVQATYTFDAVLSDNRYGLHHPDVFSVFITHQLRIKAPVAFAEKILQKINYGYIKRFNECWIPDETAAPGLAGALAHPQQMPAVPVRYIGPLSRFQPNEEPGPQRHVLILLSGPEPQRSMLEDLLLQQLRHYTEPVVFVRGLPEAAQLPPAAKNISMFNHLGAAALQQVMQEAFFVIARSGYSTVMDLMVLRKKSVLIPTPGQTEQEYLAAHLMQQQYACCVSQKQFNLQVALKKAALFPYHFPLPQKRDGLEQALLNLFSPAPVHSFS